MSDKTVLPEEVRKEIAEIAHGWTKHPLNLLFSQQDVERIALLAYRSGQRDEMEKWAGDLKVAARKFWDGEIEAVALRAIRETKEAAAKECEKLRADYPVETLEQSAVRGMAVECYESIRSLPEQDILKKVLGHE